jgi:hypothetical protein
MHTDHESGSDATTPVVVRRTPVGGAWTIGSFIAIWLNVHEPTSQK